MFGMRVMVLGAFSVCFLFSFPIACAKQGMIRVLGRCSQASMHNKSVVLQPIPLFVQTLFKQSFLIALGKEEASEKNLSDKDYGLIGQQFLEKHILANEAHRIRFFVCAHQCMEMIWYVHPKNFEYTTVVDFKKLKEVRRSVKVLIQEVRILCKQSSEQLSDGNK